MSDPAIEVVSAIILRPADHKLLVACRSSGRDYPYHWEVPGGKLEPGESPEAGLRRECWEELRLRIWTPLRAPQQVFEVTMQPPVVPRATRIRFYRVWMRSEPEPHDVLGFGWASPHDLDRLQLIPGLEAVVTPLKLLMLTAAQERRTW